MSGLGGFVAGALGLTMLQVAVSNAPNTAAVITVPAKILARWIDPYTPLIPDLRTTTQPGN